MFLRHCQRKVVKVSDRGGIQPRWVTPRQSEVLTWVGGHVDQGRQAQWKLQEDRQRIAATEEIDKRSRLRGFKDRGVQNSCGACDQAWSTCVVQMLCEGVTQEASLQVAPARGARSAMHAVRESLVQYESLQCISRWHLLVAVALQCMQ